MGDLPDTRGKKALARAFERVVMRAGAANFIETVTPPAIGAAGAAALLASASWAGLWGVLPPVIRAPVSVLAYAGAGAAAGTAAVFTLAAIYHMTTEAGRRAAVARIDRASGLPHHPASQLADRLAPSQTAQAAVIWDATRAGLLQQVGQFKVGKVRVPLLDRDPYYAVRIAVPVMLAAAYLMAPGQHWERVQDAFAWHDPVVIPPPEIYAWATPPGYTKEPPVIVSRVTDADFQGTADVTLPAGTTLNVQVYKDSVAEITAEGGAADVPSKTPAAKDTVGRQLVLTDNAVVTVMGNNHLRRTWRISVVRDQAPTVATDGLHDMGRKNGTLGTNTTIHDDYAGARVTGARLTCLDCRETGDPREAPRAMMVPAR